MSLPGGLSGGTVCFPAYCRCLLCHVLLRSLRSQCWMWEQLHCHIPSQRSDFCVCPAAHTHPPSELYRQSELPRAGTGVFPAPDPPSELYRQSELPWAGTGVFPAPAAHPAVPRALPSSSTSHYPCAPHSPEMVLSTLSNSASSH